MVNNTLKSGEVLVIRQAQPTDAAALIAYVKQISDETQFLTFSSEEFQMTEAQEAALLQNYLETPNRLFLLAILEQELVGILHIFGNSKQRLQHIGELGMSVAKAHWHKGVGTLLLSTGLDWATNNPVIRKIDLGVQADNAAAIHLYYKLGFEREGRQSRGSLINGQFYDVILMGKKFD